MEYDLPAWNNGGGLLSAIFVFAFLIAFLWYIIYLIDKRKYK